MGEGSKKYRSFRMCLNLNDYQFKGNRYNYVSIYMNPMVTVSQKYITDTHTKRNSSILQKKIIKPQRRNKKKEEMNKEEPQKQLGKKGLKWQ